MDSMLKALGVNPGAPMYTHGFAPECDQPEDSARDDLTLRLEVDADGYVILHRTQLVTPRPV